jgi:PIN domain nuclease of toxin-antitoxin system
MASDPGKIKPQAWDRIRAAKSPVRVSAISLYEVANLSRRRRIDLQMPMQKWFDLAFADDNLNLIPVTSEIAISAALLPDGFHGDPVDRLIAATARVHNLVLCTHDDKLLRFGQQGIYKFLEV